MATSGMQVSSRRPTQSLATSSTLASRVGGGEQLNEAALDRNRDRKATGQAL